MNLCGLNLSKKLSWNICRTLPVTLDPLLPWLQNDVPEDVLGINPANCLVFLSPTDWSQLPEVPDQIPAEDDLPFVEDVTTPKPWVFFMKFTVYNAFYVCKVVLLPHNTYTVL